MNNEQKPKTSSSIVSIACSKLNTRITSTTSTTTTPEVAGGPQQTSSQYSKSISTPSTSESKYIAASSPPSTSSSLLTTTSAFKSALSSSSASPMSDAAAAAAGQHGGTSSNAQSSSNVSAACVLKQDAPICTIASVDIASNTPALVTANSTPKVAATEISSNTSSTSNNSNSSNIADKSKKSETWEDSHLNDWDESHLKNLLEEAYSYKNPRDKENKSEIFLQLLHKVENEKEDQTFAFRAIASRYTRNSSTSTASNSQKQGGSLQDLVDAVRNDPLDCDYNFSVSGQRNRRHNHNSRQKKYSSVSSRQREGGSLPSNVNVTYCGGGGSSLLSALDQQPTPSFMHEVKNNSNSKQQQRRNKANERSPNVVAATLEIDLNIYSGDSAASTAPSVAAPSGGGVSGPVSVASGGVGVGGNAVTNCSGGGGGDCVIEMGEPMMDIQQQQKILQSKGQDAATQGLPYYDRLDNIDMRIPRGNIINSMQTKPDFAPTNPQCYVDETVRFTTLEKSSGGGGDAGGGGSTGDSVSITENSSCGPSKVSSTIDTKYLPLDENYKSCKSILGEKTDPVKTPSSIFSNLKTITRQYDESELAALEELYQMGPSPSGVSAAALLNATTAGGHPATVSQSQAKAKNKKKSQQDRNTKTVDVKSVAGYRGNDPIEELVKYIESTKDKQTNDKSNSSSNKLNDNSKKKERKKDKEKQQKMKKSNSLEELRSCSKIDVDELKTSAATTESNTIMRNKGGKNKNNSASAADINKNFYGKELTAATTKSAATTASSASPASNSVSNRKGERRSWGTEELQYLGDSNSNEDKTAITKEKKNAKNKEKDTEKEGKENKEEKAKEKPIEKQDKNANITNETHPGAGVTTAATTTPTPTTTTSSNKSEKSEKRKKSESHSTILHGDDILAMESLLPEAAEFHVVTKKKKPKKQRSSVDETNTTPNASVGGFSRTNNFMSNVHKSAGTATQRYKYYNSHATNNDYLNSYNNHSNHNSQNVSDKSRRKSTSSMPPSEKSDSSDLDSVHSLPIESTSSSKNKQRHKNNNTNADEGGSSSSSSATTATKTSTNTSPAPISYADIARTNKEKQISVAANSSNDKWPTVDVNGNNNTNMLINNPASAIEAGVLENSDQSSSTPTQQVVPATTTKYKTKKSASKPDFPELIATVSPLSSSTTATTTALTNDVAKQNNIKPISYSQSLTAVLPTTTVAPNTAPLPSSSSNSSDVVTIAPALTSPADANTTKEKFEKRGNVVTDLIKIDLATTTTTQSSVTTNTNQRQQPHHTQQPLQKSKSVDHESYNYNTSNLDQQYPALEKTVKRHSSSTVVVGATAMVPGNATGGSFNFAAAAKQQTQANNNEESNPNTVATTSSASSSPAASMSANVCKSITVTTTAPATTTTPPVASSNTNAISVTDAVATNISTAKKAKEKTSQTSSSSSLATTAETWPNNQLAANVVVVRKMKKERQNQQTFELNTLKSTTATQTTGANKIRTQSGSSSINNNNNNNIPSANGSNIKSSNHNIINNTNSSNATAKSNNKSNSLAKQNSTCSNAPAPAATSAATNRPAVIILNDDRTVGGNASNNEFTFGDFNEDELKFFDDDDMIGADGVNEDDDYEDGGGDDDNINTAEEDDYPVDTEYDNLNNAIPPLTTGIKSTKAQPTMQKLKASPSTVVVPTAATNSTNQQMCLNDSGANFNTTSASSSSSTNSDVGVCVLNSSTQHVDEIMLLSAVDSSSPNTSLLVGGNQSSDSGIYTGNKAKIPNAKRISPTKDVGTTTITNNDAEIETTTSETTKLNTFLNTPTSEQISATTTTNSATTTSNNPETHGSSEATNKTNAGGAAAAVSLPPPQQLETCNDIETAIIAAARAAAEQHLQHHHHQHNHPPPPNNQQANSNASSTSSSFSSSSVSIESKYSYSPQQQQQKPQQNPYHHHHQNYCYPTDENVRSRSSSSSHRESSVGHVQRKELDVHFIPPTMPTGMSSLQHNEIIIDFIGSAWEEVANSKVTKFYDGQ